MHEERIHGHSGDWRLVQGMDVQVGPLAGEAGTDPVTEKIDAELDRVREVIRQAPEAICITAGPEHRILALNPACRKITGRDTAAGETVPEAFPELAQQGFVDILDEVCRTGEGYEGRERVVLRPGADGVTPEPAFFNVAVQPLPGTVDATCGVVLYAVEVTAQVLARQVAEEKAAALTRLTAELQRSNEELDRFARVASHDLKAPLRGIARLTEWLEEDLGDRLDAEARDFMRLLRARVERMQALIEGILEYARVARDDAVAADVDVAAVLGEIIDLLEPEPECVVEIGDDMPVVHAQPSALRQIFLNLIDNALKHAGRRPLRVRVSVRDNGAFHEFSVADDGHGIAPEHHERIWEAFEVLGSACPVRSTGLGLALVKKIVTARGGEVRVESAVGAGADFRFLWPRRRS